MSTIVLPALFAVLVWWASTGVILYLDGLPRRTHRYTLAGATALLPCAFYGLVATRGEASVAAAYGAFASAIAVWAWVEVAFLLGYVTGPRRVPCSADGREGRRFVQAFATILWHELALLALGAVVLLLTWGAPNPVGAATFAVLWALRLSAKLNLFLGVRNVGAEMLPPHLAYLATYFARRPMNLLFPVTVTAATAASALAWLEALAATSPAFDTVAFALAGTLLALGVLEHWMMVLPIPTSALWSLGMRSRDPRVTARP
ncbi:MAG: putative photosynthetic complex assembly protein PuhE [Burkholderiales bacterium]